jgi:hypothetical protein
LVFKIKEGSVDELKQEIAEVRKEKKILFAVTKTMPVYIGESIFNYKLLKAIDRKLKKHNVEVFVEQNNLVIRFKQPFSKNHGEFVLYELPKEMFVNLKRIPKIDIERWW